MPWLLHLSVAASAVRQCRSRGGLLSLSATAEQATLLRSFLADRALKPIGSELVEALHDCLERCDICLARGAERNSAIAVEEYPVRE